MLAKVEDLARALIAEHGDRAVFVAVDRSILLSKSIDQSDWHARNFWAQVLHAIHGRRRSDEFGDELVAAVIVGNQDRGSRAAAASASLAQAAG
jgi:hypothetical protein